MSNASANSRFHHLAKYLQLCDESDVEPTLYRMCSRKSDGLVEHMFLCELVKMSSVRQLSFNFVVSTRFDRYRELNCRMNNFRRRERVSVEKPVDMLRENPQHV